MANKRHLARLKQGVAAWNQWRDENPKIWPDLREADLRGKDLREANLAGAFLNNALFHQTFLDGANLVEAQLIKTDLTLAHLTKAHLTRANLALTNLAGANLTDVDLTEAELSVANFQAANLMGTNFSKARIAGTIFMDVDLHIARGLETAIHLGPSSIGVDTLYRSKGEIPEVFLRGAGVPDEMITYTKSLVGRPFEHNSCFISYSSKDEEFAEHLYADLQNKGVRCWFAPHDVQGGRKLHEQIDQAIHVHERLLLILSSYSMQSEWVKTEIAKARQREVEEQRQVLFPVRLVPFEAIRGWECFDADTGKDSAREIREYFIPDFSNWKNYDTYQVTFQRLLRDLKADI